PPGTTLRSATLMPNASFFQDIHGVRAISHVAVGDGGAVVTTTFDQVMVDPNNPPHVLSGNWTTTLVPAAPNLRSVTVGGATGFRFLAVGQGGAAVFGDSVINDVATGVQVSINPIQWSVASQPATGDFSSVHFFLGQYLTLGGAGANAVSH